MASAMALRGADTTATGSEQGAATSTNTPAARWPDPNRDLTEDERGRIAALIEVLGQRGQATSKELDTRRQAVSELRKLRHRSTIPVLIQLAKDPSEDRKVRRSAIRALSRTRQKEAVAPLIDLITTDDNELCHQALVGLSNVTRTNVASVGDPAYRGRDHGFIRQDMQARWQQWWKLHESSFVPNLHGDEMNGGGWYYY